MIEFFTVSWAQINFNFVYKQVSSYIWLSIEPDEENKVPNNVPVVNMHSMIKRMLKHNLIAL